MLKEEFSYLKMQERLIEKKLVDLWFIPLNHRAEKSSEILQL